MARRRSKIRSHANRAKAIHRTSPTAWILPILLIGTALVFSLALNFDLVYDDAYQIAQNPTITSWSYLPQYFRSHVWGYSSTWTNYYRPLFLVALRLWESVVGFDPVGWHGFPIIVHLLNVGLVFVVIRKLTRSLGTGLIAASVFALHPVQIEAVASVFGVTDALMALWLLSSFWCYLKWKEFRRPWWAVFSAMLFAAALLTKESAIVFPLVLLAYELTVNASGPLSKEDDQTPLWRFGFLVPSLVIVAMYLLVRHAVLGTTFGYGVAPVSWSTVVMTAPLSLLVFVRLLLVPYGMSSFYNSPYVTYAGWSRFVLPTLGLLAIVIAVGYWARRTKEPLVGFAAIWALLGVLPVLNIRLMQESDFVHIRFLYLPCVAVSLLLAIALRQIIADKPYRIAVAVGVVVSLGIATLSQIGYLRHNLTMFERGVEIAPNNPIAKNNLADEYVKAGRIDEATALLDDNLRRHPNFWMSNYNRGYLAYQKQNWPQVDTYMGRAITSGGDQVQQDAYVYRGFALAKLGRATEGEQLVREAIARHPQQKTYHFVLGLVLRQQQKWDEALQAFEQELVINPSDQSTALHVADLRLRLGK